MVIGAHSGKGQISVVDFDMGTMAVTTATVINSATPGLEFFRDSPNQLFGRKIAALGGRCGRVGVSAQWNAGDTRNCDIAVGAPHGLGTVIFITLDGANEHRSVVAANVSTAA